MKKTIVLAAILCIGFAAFSQDSSTMRPMSGDTMGKMHHKMMGRMKDCVMMHEGTPMVMRGGQNMPLAQQMTFPNGTVVMPDGNVKMKDGSTKMLKDGECIYMDGTMGRMPMMDNKMKMKKDSTMM